MTKSAKRKKSVETKAEPARSFSVYWLWIKRVVPLIFLGGIVCNFSYALGIMENQASASLSYLPSEIHWQLNGFPSNYSYRNILDLLNDSSSSEDRKTTKIYLQQPNLAMRIGDRLIQTGLYKNVSVNVIRKKIAIHVEQRKPILCIPLTVNTSDGTPLACYVDEEGFLLPFDSDVVNRIDRCLVLDGLNVTALPSVGEQFQIDEILQCAQLSSILENKRDRMDMIAIVLSGSRTNTFRCELVTKRNTRILWSSHIMKESRKVMIEKYKRLIDFFDTTEYPDRFSTAKIVDLTGDTIQVKEKDSGRLNTS